MSMKHVALRRKAPDRPRGPGMLAGLSRRAAWVCLLVGMAVFLLGPRAVAAAPPDVRVFVVDPVTIAALPAADQQVWLDHIAQDIVALTEPGPHAPRNGWALLTRTKGLRNPFMQQTFGAGVPAGAADMRRVLLDALAAVKGGTITGPLELTALRVALLRLLNAPDIGARSPDVVMHVFADQWIVNNRAVARAVVPAASETTRRPTTCFVDDLGTVAEANYPWPESHRLSVELRPPPSRPTPSQRALDTMTAVLIGKTDPSGFGASLGIAGPLCPPGSIRNLTLTALNDPSQCADDAFDSSTAHSVAVCRAATPFLAARGTGLVQRPLNLVAVSGSGGAGSLTVVPAAAPGGASVAHDLGGVPFSTNRVPALASLRPVGSGGMLRAIVDASRCAVPGPVSEVIDLTGASGPTRVELVTAPLPCAVGLSAPMVFDLLPVQVE